jgi:large subunit ribosomal protein L3
MQSFILGKKIGMTTIHDEKGALNVTLVECAGNKVSLIKTVKKDGYSAVQVEMAKSKKGKVKREFKADDVKLEKDNSLDISIFNIGDVVNVRGISKAKGFQGVVKRHGFKGAPKTHGHKHDLRAPGSIGATYPEHVIKGKRMAGRMGGVAVTNKDVKVVYLDKDKNTVGLKGSVPGIPGGIVEIYKK